MKTVLYSTQQPNLLIYFAGWGTPISAVSHLKRPVDYDLLICYDYQDLALNVDFSTYQHFRLVAWSMGVWVAEQTLSHLPFLSATAVNGTGSPCDEQCGILPAIFQGTLENLAPTTLAKFQRRMAGKLTPDYQALPHQREFAEIQQELTALNSLIQSPTPNHLRWTNAIIGLQDKIFSPQNQLNYWQDRTLIQQIAGEHYLFPTFSYWAELWEK